MNRPLGLGKLVPPSLLAGKWIVMLTCYLDDSGKDPQNRITTLAGFVAKDDQWLQFESAVEPIFERYKVGILHAKELHHTENDFAQWPVLKKQSFVYQACKELSPRVPLGVSMSALKSTYKQRVSESKRKRTVTPYTFCFNVILDWILRDVRIGREVHEDGLALVLECGHENNGEAEQCFHSVRKKYALDGILRSISFVPKTECRAIQMADLIAFYSRRHGLDLLSPQAKRQPPMIPSIIDIIAGAVPLRSFVATDFHDQLEQSS